MPQPPIKTEAEAVTALSQLLGQANDRSLPLTNSAHAEVRRRLEQCFALIQTPAERVRLTPFLGAYYRDAESTHGPSVCNMASTYWRIDLRQRESVARDAKVS